MTPVRPLAMTQSQNQPKRFRTDARAFVLAWGAAITTGCIPGPSAERSSMRALERREIAPSGLPGTIVSYLRAGDVDAPNVIYVHGTPGDATAFADLLLTPVDGLNSIAVDRPGFGKTTPLLARVSYEDQARAIEPLLVERDGRWPILVGHSLGGPIVARVAADNPDRVGGLVIVAGSLDPELEDPKWFNTLARRVPAIVPGVMRRSNDEILAAPDETRALEGVLDRVRCPVVIIHGTEDGLVPVENVRFMQRRFVNARSVETTILDGEGHFILWSHDDLIREAVARLAQR